MVDQYDIAIIGAGPGGYVAAIRAAQLGFKIVCIDKNISLGGTCLNVGCIPSKTLLQGTELLLHLKNQGQDFGIDASQVKIDFSQLMSRKKQVVKGLVEGIGSLFLKHQITFVQGTAEFIDPHTLKVTHQKNSLEIKASYIIIATGSESIALPEIQFDERQVVSSTGALSLSKIPEKLIVVGAGVIGVELASVYRRLGSEVTIIEMLDRICPTLDEDLSKNLLKILQKQGIKFYLSSKVINAVVQPDEIILTADLNEKIQNLSTNILLVAVGRRPYTHGLNLEKAGVEKNKKEFILVDGNLRTSQSHIFAIGDVIEGTMLAHRASAEGTAVIEFLNGVMSENPNGERYPLDYLSIPNVIYTYPEVASIGLTESEAKQNGIELMVGKSFFRGNSRARCSGETEGFVKVIGDKKSGVLVGMHILGPHASEMIAEGMLAIQKKTKVIEIANAPQAHPTLSEAIKEAALDALGRPIHH